MGWPERRLGTVRCTAEFGALPGAAGDRMARRRSSGWLMALVPDR